jgi:hypothetical protein
VAGDCLRKSVDREMHGDELVSRGREGFIVVVGVRDLSSVGLIKIVISKVILPRSARGCQAITKYQQV